MNTPRAIEDVNIEWLNQILFGKTQTAVISSFNTRILPVQGSTSLTYLLLLTYRAALNSPPAKSPSKLLVKFSSNNPLIRDAIEKTDGFAREVNFYRDISNNAAIPTPKCYFSHYDPVSGDSCLLLSYIDNAKITELGNSQVEDIFIAIKHLARFNAAWWQKTEQLPGVIDDDDPKFRAIREANIKSALAIIEQSYSDQVGEDIIAILRFWLTNAEQLAQYSKGRPQILCHGDFHRQQLMFGYDGGPEFTVIDWQTVALDHCGNDLARLIGLGMLPEQITKHESQLLDHYFEVLQSEGVKAYDREALWLDYRLGMVKQIVHSSQIFAIADIQVSLDWWQEHGIKAGSLWQVLFQWPGERVRQYQVLPLLQSIVY